MSAPAAVGVDRPTLRIRGTAYPVLLPTIRDPRLHLAAIIVTLQVLGQVAFDFQLSIAQILVSLADGRCPRVRHHLLAAARAHVARECPPHRQRRRVRPARARHRARRLVEHEGLVDLRRHVGSGAPVQVRDPRARQPRLQPVELRPRPLLPAARSRARGSAGALVGTALAGARAGARADRGRRVPHPAPTASPGDRGRLLARVCGRDRSARRERPHDDRRLARRADRGGAVLVAPRLVARDPRVPLLHDHRPEDDALGPRRAPRPTRSGSACWRRCSSHRRRPSSRPRWQSSPRSRSSAPREGSWSSSDRRASRRDARSQRCLGRLPRARFSSAPSRSAPSSSPPESPRDPTPGGPSSPPTEARSPRSSSPTGRVWPRSTRRRRRRSRGTSSPISASSRRPCDGATSTAPQPRPEGAWLASLWAQIRTPGAEATVARYDVDRVVLTLHRGAYQGPPSVVANLQGTYVASTYGRTEAALATRDPVRFRRTVELVLDGGDLPDRALGGRSPARDVGGPAGERHARRNDVRRRRETGRARLPAGRIPLRRLERHDGDDGRRPLLARLRPRRPARSLRRELVQPDGRRRLGGEGRAAAERPLPQRRRDVRGREPARRRRPAAPRKRLRRGRLQRGRRHGPLRDHGGLQRPDGHVRRAALERRRRDVLRGRAGSRDRRTGLACGRGR